jgi:hypothetical protein
VLERLPPRGTWLWGPAASLELETETGPRPAAGLEPRRPSQRSERGVEEAEIWECSVGMMRVKESHLMRAFFFFSMTGAVARHPDRTDGCVLSLSLDIAWCLTYIAVAFRDRPFLSTMPSCSLSITDSSIGGSRWRSADQCYCASTCGLPHSDLCS